MEITTKTVKRLYDLIERNLILAHEGLKFYKVKAYRQALEKFAKVESSRTEYATDPSNNWWWLNARLNLYKAWTMCSELDRSLIEMPINVAHLESQLMLQSSPIEIRRSVWIAVNFGRPGLRILDMFERLAHKYRP